MGLITQAYNQMISKGMENGCYSVAVMENYINTYTQDKRYKLKILASTTNFSSMICLYMNKKYYLSN